MARILLALYITVFAATLLPAPARAESSTFKQKILPLDCVFQTIIIGDNQFLYYLTPEECGQVIIPMFGPGEPEAPDDNSAPVILPTVFLAPEPEAPSPSPSAPVPQAEHHPDFTEEQHTAVTVQSGHTYFFELPADHVQRSIFIASIGQDSITLRFAPGGASTTLREGETAEEDVDHDGLPDIGVSVKDITPFKKAILEFWFITKEKDGDSGRAAPDNTLLIVTLAPVVIVAAALALLHRRKHRR